MSKYNNAVERYTDLILKTQDYIWANPETGYKEWKTSKYMEDTFEALGYDLVRAGDITGFYTVLDTGCEGPEVLVLGDLYAIIPSVHPYAPGASGISHGADYRIADPMLACVASAKWQLNMLALLLSDGGARAKQIINDFKPRFTSKEEYFDYVEAFASNGDRIDYTNDCATVRI